TIDKSRQRVLVQIDPHRPTVCKSCPRHASLLYVGVRVPMESQPHVTRRKRSRFRPLHSFSLRSLLVLIVVFAIPIAWIAKERRQSTYELELAEQLRKQ